MDDKVGDNFSLSKFSLGEGSTKDKQDLLAQVVNHLVRDEKHRKLAKDYILKIKKHRNRKQGEINEDSQNLPNDFISKNSNLVKCYQELESQRRALYAAVRNNNSQRAKMQK